MNMAYKVGVWSSREFLLASFVFVIATNYFMPIEARYIPGMNQLRQSLDGDDDDIDQDTSASYQNQDDNNNNNPSSDGYDDNEPDTDGAYEETPRDEEGQADLERFFDDHLGASEREGMDKENLPSNLEPVVVTAATAADSKPEQMINGPDQSSPLDQLAADTRTRFAVVDLDDADDPREISAQGYSSRSSQSSPKIETRYFKLPDEKLIITRQITSDSTAGKDGTDLDRMVFIPKSTYQQDQQQPLERQQQYQRDALDANGSEVVVTENDDMDKVYVTNLKNRRFKIPALGGYDPEEDFKHASEDIEKPAARRRPTNSRRRNQQPSESRNKDISFNDPEADELFNDASEVDEVTFAQDDPYQTDLEEEMKGQEYDKPGTVGQSKQLQEEESEPRTRQELANKDKDDDDSESAWVNDGVDDMDIPSQSHQDNVLDKAAKQEALARRAAEDEAREAQAEAEGEPNAKSNDESSQRMPNAEYLKDDLKSIDDVD